MTDQQLISALAAANGYIIDHLRDCCKDVLDRQKGYIQYSPHLCDLERILQAAGMPGSVTRQVIERLVMEKAMIYVTHVK